MARETSRSWDSLRVCRDNNPKLHRDSRKKAALFTKNRRFAVSPSGFFSFGFHLFARTPIRGSRALVILFWDSTSQALITPVGPGASLPIKFSPTFLDFWMVAVHRDTLMCCKKGESETRGRERKKGRERKELIQSIKTFMLSIFLQTHKE